MVRVNHSPAEEDRCRLQDDADTDDQQANELQPDVDHRYPLCLIPEPGNGALQAFSYLRVSPVETLDLILTSITNVGDAVAEFLRPPRKFVQCSFVVGYLQRGEPYPSPRPEGHCALDE